MPQEGTTEPRVQSMTEKEVIKQRDENPNSSKILFLVEAYRPAYYYWEVVEAGRRLALTSALSILQSGSLVQLFLGLWLCIFMAMAYIEFKPHIRFREYVLSLITQLQIFLVFMASILSGYSGGMSDSTGLSVLLITTTVIVLVLGVGIIFGEVVEMLGRFGLGDSSAQRENQSMITQRLSGTLRRSLRWSPSNAIEMTDYRTQEEFSMDGQLVVVDNPLYPDAPTSHGASGNRQSWDEMRDA